MLQRARLCVLQCGMHVGHLIFLGFFDLVPAMRFFLDGCTVRTGKTTTALESERRVFSQALAHELSLGYLAGDARNARQ